jgi:hypothetical protein
MSLVSAQSVFRPRNFELSLLEVLFDGFHLIHGVNNLGHMSDNPASQGWVFPWKLPGRRPTAGSLCLSISTPEAG